MATMACEGMTVHGTACRRKPMAGSTWCAVHHPDMVARHREGARRGGMGRSAAVSPLAVDGLDLETLDGLRGLLARSLAKAAELRFSEKTANAIGTLAGQLRQLLQDADLLRRIEALEKGDDPHKPSEPWAA